MAKIIVAVDSLMEEARKAVESLAKVDPQTAAIFKEVAPGDYLKGAIARFSALADQADKLPPLPASTIATDLTEENTILIETADKTEAVRFAPSPRRPRSIGTSMATPRSVPRSSP